MQVGTRFPFAGGPANWDDPVTVPGWRTFLPPFGDPGVVNAGVLNPPFVDQNTPFITGQDGQHVMAAQAAAMQQTLDIQLQPNTHYRLSFLAGIGMFDPDYVVFAALVAAPDLETIAYQGQPNVATLVQTQAVFPPPESKGTMARYAIEYTSPATLPADLAGRYVAIGLIGSDGVPRVCFDDFRLEATLVPEPASGLMLMVGVVVLVRCHDFRATPQALRSLHLRRA